VEKATAAEYVEYTSRNLLTLIVRYSFDFRPVQKLMNSVGHPAWCMRSLKESVRLPGVYIAELSYSGSLGARRLK
jgi:hypothetical protein